jgi:hypothetical protein
MSPLGNAGIPSNMHQHVSAAFPSAMAQPFDFPHNAQIAGPLVAVDGVPDPMIMA